ncbi:MAG TPA: adenosylcobinamide-GDP ribazoletransferase [Clostridia bacterium]|nr:adenosylcobinamide-GDP ribazoletransferase [Clostridia bacterium]
MKLIRSFCMALSLYSRLPVPRVAWEEGNMAYALCFFPIVGAFVAFFQLAWLILAVILGLGTVLTAAVVSLIPLAVAGGIHMDGFLDTADALGSNASRERALEIMRDPHVGASALIAGTAYMLLAFALWSEVETAAPALFSLLLVPVLSRALSALAAATFKNARGEGLLASMQKASDARAARVASALWILAAAGVMLWRSPLCGGAMLIAALVSFLAYGAVSYRRFGGATGDVAGWFVQVCELACLAAFVLAAKIGGLP